MFKPEDHQHMARALQLAAQGLYTTTPNPRVGCVIVRDGVVIGEGWHAKAGELHAEPLALQAAGDRAAGATIYVTLEPCAMCAGAMVHARVQRLVYAATDPRAGAAGSVFNVVQSPALNHRLDVDAGVLGDECGSLLRNFFVARRNPPAG